MATQKEIETAKFNKSRSEEWSKKFTEDSSRIFLMVGMKEGGFYSVLADDSLTKLKVADRLEELARELRKSF